MPRMRLDPQRRQPRELDQIFRGIAEKRALDDTRCRARGAGCGRLELNAFGAHCNLDLVSDGESSREGSLYLETLGEGDAPAVAADGSDAPGHEVHEPH